MTEHPMMAMLLEHNTFLGKSEYVEETIMPIDAQLDFKPGDAALLAQANTPLEQELTFVRCLDPAKYAETFPDWEERLLKSFVLCEIFSRTDRHLTIGWISRLKLLPISGYRYRQARRWIKHDWPEDLPNWVPEAYRKYTDQLHAQAPDVVPCAATCTSCGSRSVDLIITRTLTYTGQVGVLVIEGQERYVPVTDADEESVHTAKLKCAKCQATTELEDEQWQLPGISN